MFVIISIYLGRVRAVQSPNRPDIRRLLEEEAATVREKSTKTILNSENENL